jgi:hypothetical protein
VNFILLKHCLQKDQLIALIFDTFPGKDESTNAAPESKDSANKENTNPDAGLPLAPKPPKKLIQKELPVPAITPLKSTSEEERELSSCVKSVKESVALIRVDLETLRDRAATTEALERFSAQGEEQMNRFFAKMEASFAQWGERLEESFDKKFDNAVKKLQSHQITAPSTVQQREPVEETTVTRESEYFLIKNDLSDLRSGLQRQFALFEASLLIVMGGIMGQISRLSTEVNNKNEQQPAAEEKEATPVSEESLPAADAEGTALLARLNKPTGFEISKTYDPTRLMEAIASGNKPSLLFSPPMRRIAPKLGSPLRNIPPSSSAVKATSQTPGDLRRRLNAVMCATVPAKLAQAAPAPAQAPAATRKRAREEKDSAALRQTKKPKYVNNGAEIEGDSPILDAAVVVGLLELKPASDIPEWVREYYKDMQVFTTTTPVFSHKLGKDVTVWLTSSSERLLRREKQEVAAHGTLPCLCLKNGMLVEHL